jgi:hypothetical protein
MVAFEIGKITEKYPSATFISCPERLISGYEKISLVFLHANAYRWSFFTRKICPDFFPST